MKPPIHLEDRVTAGGRITSPTAARNCEPIAEQLAPLIPNGSRVLEIASGTGQQAAAVTARLETVFWQPSDPDADSRASLQTYAQEFPDKIKPPLNLDVTAERWWEPAGENFNRMLCANMIHIAPPEALIGLAQGAGALLPSGGEFYLYGPFLWGDDSAESNLAFSERLKLRDARWGVRESDFVKHMFAKSGLSFTRQIEMPAENHILIFSKA